jgi:hypothetical protein
MTFSNWLTLKSEFLGYFNQNFKNFTISTSDDGVEYSCDYAIIRNISFPSQGFGNLLHYQITVECRRPESFTGIYGILDPNNQISYQTNSDGTLQINHSISARGFNTDENKSNALANAKSFCNSLKGLNNAILPLFFEITSGSSCLRTVSEKINRFNGTYSIEETYVAKYDGDATILNYTTDLSSGIQDGLTSISINGEVLGCRDDTVTGLRGRYNSIDFYAIATGAYGANDLFSTPLLSGVTEDSNSKKISFNVNFNNDTGNLAWFNYNATLSREYQNDLDSINLNGTIQGRGNQKQRWAAVSGLYDTINLVEMATNAYNTYGLAYPLNPKPLTQSVSFNQFASQIGLSISMNNRPSPSCSILKSLDATINIKRGLNRFKSEQLISQAQTDANDYGNIPIDLGYWSRAEASLSLNASIFQPPTGDYTCVEDAVDDFKNTYLIKPNAYLERDGVSNRYSDINLISRQVVISYDDEDAPSKPGDGPPPRGTSRQFLP